MNSNSDTLIAASSSFERKKPISPSNTSIIGDGRFGEFGGAIDDHDDINDFSIDDEDEDDLKNGADRAGGGGGSYDLLQTPTKEKDNAKEKKISILGFLKDRLTFTSSPFYAATSLSSSDDDVEEGAFVSGDDKKNQPQKLFSSEEEEEESNLKSNNSPPVTSTRTASIRIVVCTFLLFLALTLIVQFKVNGEDVAEVVQPDGGAMAYDAASPVLEHIQQDIQEIEGKGAAAAAANDDDDDDTKEEEDEGETGPADTEKINVVQQHGKNNKKGRGRGKGNQTAKITVPSGAAGGGAKGKPNPAAAAGKPICFFSRKELQGAIDLYLYAQNNESLVDEYEEIVGPKYGSDIQSWCFMPRVKDFSNLFDANWNVHAQDFNANITGWDVSHVERMDSMFANAAAFNQPIGTTWNIQNVRSMSHMFHGAASFNQDLSTWDTSNVEDMSFVFANATSFHQPLNSWNVSNVKYTNGMFQGAAAFNQPLDAWNVQNVQTMAHMFDSANNFNQSINRWNISSVTSFVAMFRFAHKFNQDLCAWGNNIAANPNLALEAFPQAFRLTFQRTACPNPQLPQTLNASTTTTHNPVGPLCHVCL